VLSFGDFSLHEQRKVTRSSAGRAEAVARRRPHPKQKLDSGLRRNDEHRATTLDSRLRGNDERKAKQKPE
jgi:hypothetical protein